MYLYNIQLFGFFDAKRAKRFKSGNKGYAIYSGEDSKSQKIINKKKHHVSRSRLLIKEYVFFPVLSFFIGGSVVQVLIAHFIIDIAVNFWLTLCLEVGHIPKKLQKKDTVLNTGEWYVSQIESSINFKGNRIWTTLWGHLNYQIEHHLFPDLCSRKLRDASSSVQDLCRVHGIEYTLYPNWRSAILAFLKVFVRYSRRPKESEIKG